MFPWILLVVCIGARGYFSPVSGYWSSHDSKCITALWNLGPHKHIPWLHSFEISRTLGNRENLKYHSSTFYGINLRVPSACESWGICEDALLCVPRKKCFSQNRFFFSFFFFLCKISQFIKKTKYILEPDSALNFRSLNYWGSEKDSWAEVAQQNTNNVFKKTNKHRYKCRNNWFQSFLP